MKLLLENYVHNEKLTLVDFIYLFLVKLNQKHDTIFEDGSIQCGDSRERSLGDITEI